METPGDVCLSFAGSIARPRVADLRVVVKRLKRFTMFSQGSDRWWQNPKLVFLK